MDKYETYEDFLAMNENINISEIDFYKAGYKSIYDVLQSTIKVILLNNTRHSSKYKNSKFTGGT